MLELKLGQWLMRLADRQTFNRTMLELKPGFAVAENQLGIVTFNRTMLELKQVRLSVGLIREQPFNRTMLELKPSRSGDVGGMVNAFNRTMLELKLNAHGSKWAGYYNF